MIKRCTLACIPVAVLLAACSGGGPSKTPTPASTAGVTASPTAAPPPARPIALKDYAPVAAQYLTASPSAAGNCLAALYAAWGLPPGGCTAGNTDGDPEDELVAVFTGPAAPDAGTSQFIIAVLDHRPDGYTVAWSSEPQDIADQPLSPVLATGDLLGDGGGELAYVTTACGASTCTQTVHVVKGAASGYATLPPADGVSIADATSMKVEDADGDGVKEIVLTSGEVGSVAAGPQRPHTDVWAWDGSAFALRSTTPAPSTYLYHAVKDADALFASGRYADAETAYLAAVGNDSLLVFYTDKNERDELAAYALFRAGVAVLMAGGDRDTAAGYFTRANGYAGTLNHQLAGAFEAAYAAKGSVGIACGAVREDVQSNLGEYTTFWDFGYDNPPFDPATVCPL